MAGQRPNPEGLGLRGEGTREPELTRRLTEMLVEVDRECIGTGGCASKSAALRCAVKQSCEVGAVPHTRNLRQRSDGHLTPGGATRLATYPARGHATRDAKFRCGSQFENLAERSGRNSSQD